MHGGPVAHLADSTQTTEDDEHSNSQREPVWLNGRHRLETRTPQNPDTPKSSDPGSGNQSRPAGGQSAGGGQPPADTPAPEISLSRAEIALSPGSTSSDITARITPAAENMSWSVTLADAAARDLTVINGDPLEAATLFRIRADNNAKPGTYQITITATLNEVVLTKILTVTVQ